jgi:hypothetical protein
VLLGKGPGRVDLHGQANGTVKEFYKDTQILPISKILLFMLPQELIEGSTVFGTEGDPLQRIGMAGIDGPDRGADPFFGVVTVRSFLADKSIQQFAAKINAENTVFSEKDREIPGEACGVHIQQPFLF